MELELIGLCGPLCVAIAIIVPPSRREGNTVLTRVPRKSLKVQLLLAASRLFNHTFHNQTANLAKCRGK